MRKHGLIHVFNMSILEGNMVINLTIYHTSGEHLDSTVPILQNVQLAKMNAFQVLGAGISYMKRYLLVSLLGITTTDSDADQCLPDKTNPADITGKDVRSAYTKQPLTGKQIDTGDLL